MAYIDPGTAGQVISSSGGIVIGFLVGVLGVIGLFFKKILAFFKQHTVLAFVLGAVVVPAIVFVAYLLSQQ